MSGFFIDAGSSRAITDRDFAEIASALHYSCVSSSSLSLSDPLLEFVIDVFVCAALQYVQKGNNLQSSSTETLIVLLGCCNTAEVGGGFCIEQ